MNFISRISNFLAFFVTFSVILTDASTQVQTQPFEWDGVPKVTAVGDVHGDFDALVKILTAEGLMDQKYRWIGQDRHLVMLGDLVAGGERSRDVIELIISLETQAQKSGGRVHSLLGNHDLIVASGDFASMSKSDRQAFVDKTTTKPKDINQKLTEMFLGDGPYSNWMASRPIVLRINDQLFVHAGIDDRVSGLSIDQINRIASEWILFFQGRGKQPDPKTGWIVGIRNGKFRHNDGLAFNRDFKITRQVRRQGDKAPKGAIKRKQLHELLAEFEVRKMVIGHVPTPENKIKLKHPYYRQLVVSVDTQISDRKLGRLSSLEINNGKFQKLYFDRPNGRVPSVNSCRSALMD